MNPRINRSLIGEGGALVKAIPTPTSRESASPASSYRGHPPQEESVSDKALRCLDALIRTVLSDSSNPRRDAVRKIPSLPEGFLLGYKKGKSKKARLLGRGVTRFLLKPSRLKLLAYQVGIVQGDLEDWCQKRCTLGVRHAPEFRTEINQASTAGEFPNATSTTILCSNSNECRVMVACLNLFQCHGGVWCMNTLDFPGPSKRTSFRQSEDSGPVSRASQKRIPFKILERPPPSQHKLSVSKFLLSYSTSEKTSYATNIQPFQI
ncbi:uncharacterized protein BDR25DRAFT_348735 [Lindgomyces ingoldianus]|uniref:Uncharacterized protein n=1 Tax=Lindgomyces ingoldianus TaxID=673940 RepID=A0ACB6RER2_9PLEO|nr:uncharacterized protein BDR25DRAFT_348735 [Lindgomyces ingoldianus]KAF2476810.1 hypothetical protein BDR25DRAFT_348735 [Lindgomyces ingoldianus]